MNSYVYRPVSGDPVTFGSLSGFYVWARENLPSGTIVHGTSVNDGAREYGTIHAQHSAPYIAWFARQHGMTLTQAHRFLNGE